MALMLVRHTTPSVLPGTCYGRTDLGLADSFPAEAAQTAARMPPVTRIVSSPLQRCRRLAAHLSGHHHLPLAFDDRLQEMDFGTWEGLFWSDIPRTELDAWAADFLHARPHGGESVDMLRQRTNEAIATHHAAGEATLFVTHAGVIKAALATGDQSVDFQTQVDFGAFVTLSPKQGDVR